jgi:hypothetical protein
MSVGLIMGARDKPTDPVAGQPTPAHTPAPTATGADCRPETQAVAQRLAHPVGKLTIVLQIRTDTSAVWICTDQAGRLYYHANRGGAEARWVENETALFLDDVVQKDGGYLAVATDSKGQVTTFSVDSKRLLITHKDGKPEKQVAIPQ